MPVRKKVMMNLLQEDLRPLRFHVELLNDLEALRIATENRLRILTRSEEDKDGEVRGFGLAEDDPDVLLYSSIAAELAQIEQQSIKRVQKAVKKGPLATYVKQATGVGEKQAARLLATIGDPYWHVAEDRPRTVMELWAYCGYRPVNGQAQRRTKGQKSNWNPDARMRARLIAESCIKTKGKYRDVYDEWRAKYADSVHNFDCPQCHAKKGEPLKDGHKHARALRKVAKRVLADMWEAARDIHQQTAEQN